MLYFVIWPVIGSYPSPMYETVWELKDQWVTDTGVICCFNTETKEITKYNAAS